MLYVLFFLFRDGRGLARNIRSAMPLSDAYNQRLLDKFVGVVRATVKGNVVIAAIQGTIGGVTLWLLGIDAALLWGALMVFLSLLPAVGAAIVWVPIAVYLFMTGAVWEGVVLVFVGAAVIGLVDNILRPVLVGKDTRLPDYVILVSTVGGLSIFGINGFVIGPLIAALFVAGWTIFREERDDVRRRAAAATLDPRGLGAAGRPAHDDPPAVGIGRPGGDGLSYERSDVGRKRPASRRASVSRSARAEVRRPRPLALDRLGAADLDLARLQRLGHLAHEVDVQETVLGHRLDGADVVGELEAALEGAGGDAAVEDGRLVLGLGLAAGHHELAVRASMLSSSSAKPATARVIR